MVPSAICETFEMALIGVVSEQELDIERQSTGKLSGMVIGRTSSSCGLDGNQGQRQRQDQGYDCLEERHAELKEQDE